MYNALLIFLSYFFLMVQIPAVCAQDFVTNVKHFSIENGLSNRFVRALLQDSKGFIWIGTINGLNRYDGNEFKVYNATNAGLYNEGIYSLYEDPDGMLWITYLRVGQLNIFNPQTGKAIDLEKHFGQHLPFPIEELNGIACSDTKHFYLLLRDGRIYEYLGNKKFVLRHKVNKYKTSTLLFSTIVTPTHQYFQINNQLYFLDNNWQLEKKLELPQDFSLINIDKNNNFTFYKETEQDLVDTFYTWNSLDADFKKTPFHANIMGYKNFRAELLIDNEHDIIWTLHRKFEKLELLLHKTDTSIFFNEMLFAKKGKTYWENNINVMLLDKQGLLWVGTENGVYSIDIQSNYFSTYLDKKTGFSHSMRGMAMDLSGNFYANSYLGLHTIDLQTGRYKVIEWPEKDVIGLSMLLGSDSCLWIGTEDHGIYCYLPKENKFKIFKFNDKCNDKTAFSRNTRSIWVTFEDSINHRLLIGAFNGLWIIDTENECLRAYDQYNNFSSLKTSSIYSICQHQDAIWIGSNTGLYKMHPKKGIIDHYHEKAADTKKIPNNTILFIQNAANGQLWLGTKGGGLVKLDPERGILNQYTTSHGLSDNTIYAISPERHGHIWLSSNQGLMRFSMEQERTTIFLPEQGIPHEEFNTSSYFCAPDGRIFMGGLSGIASFHPDILNKVSMESDFQAPFHITSFLQLNGKTGEILDNTAALLNSYSIELAPQDKFFLLKFSLLDYVNPKSIRYAYRIEGLNTDWVLIQENFIRIQGLASGKYTLHLRAQNAFGQWIGLKKPIQITVHPPFYKTSWFITLIIALALLLLFGFYWLRIQNLKYIQKNLEQKIMERTSELAADKEIIVQQAEALKNLDAAKTIFFTNVSHELRTPLTLILGPIKAGLDEKYGQLNPPLRNALLHAHRNSLQLKRLIDELMDLAKLEDKKLKVTEKSVLLSLLLQSTLSPFQVQAALNNIQLQFDYQLSSNLFIQVDVYKLEKIINNLLSNAFKFTNEGGTILLRVRREGTSTIEITVSDTGSGITANDLPHIFERFFQSNNPEKQPQGGTGIGLALCKELTELMGGSIQVESKVGEGSRFRVLLPLKAVGFDINSIHFEEIDPEIPQLHFQDAPKEAPTLLIVEDNGDMRLFLQEILSAHYHLVLAKNGKEALEQLALHKENINLILSDVMMPKMDGFQLLDWLKNDSYWQQIPVILLTAKVEKSDKIKALRIGVDDYITKPFDSDELELRIRNLILHYQQRQLPSEDDPKESDATEVHPTEVAETLVEFDNHWLQSVENEALKGLKKSPFQFGIVSLAEAMLLSERQFRRRLKACTGLTPIEYLKELRLQWARELIESQQYETVNEIVAAIGMNSPTYFSNLYLARFGKRPFEQLQSFRK